MRTAAGFAVRAAIDDEQLRVPAHFDAEVLSGIRRVISRRLISPAEGKQAIEAAASIDIERVAIAPRIREAFALRDRFSAGDAFYIVVAIDAGATLVTCDRGQARAADGLIPVRYVAA